MTLRLDLPDAGATEALGVALADTLPLHAVIYLEGDLGAGKTTLARALLRQLGVIGPVRSPTYTLIEHYPTPVGEVAHIDLYRIADPEELLYLGLDDLAASVRLWLVEWPERGRGALPSADLRVQLAVREPGRSVELVPGSERGRIWINSLSKPPFNPGPGPD